MAMEQFRAPALPVPTPQYEAQYLQQLVKILRIYFNQLDSDTPNKAYSYRAQHFYGGDLTVDNIDFNLNPTTPSQVGRLQWNPVENTLDLGMPHDITQQIGLEQFVRVQNNSGVMIPNGSVVGFVGAGASDTLSVTKFVANGGQPTFNILGVMTHDFPDTGDIGYCTTFGLVHDLNTTGSTVGETWALGDLLYANPTVAGALTKVKPTAPDNCVPVAVVLHVSSTAGVIFVRPAIEQDKKYGVFAKTTTQTPGAINTAYALTVDSTQVSNGVSVGSPTSRIVTASSGLYQIDAKLQINSSSSATKTVWVWIRKNGTDVANSARLVTVSNNASYAPVSISQVLSMNASDYVEIMYAADSTSVSIVAVAPTAFAPGAPALVLSVSQTQL